MTDIVNPPKLTVLLNELQRVVTGATPTPGYMSMEDHRDGTVTFHLNTAHLAHGAAAKEGLEVMETVLKRHFGEQAAAMDEVLPTENTMDLAPPSYRLSVTFPMNKESFDTLVVARKDVAVEYCRTNSVLKENPNAQIDYLADVLDSKQTAEAIAEVTGVPFVYKHSDRHAPAKRRTAVHSI